MVTASPDDRRILVSGLSKSFGAVAAVDRLSFTAPAGSITGFLGPNGAGKTTTLRMLLGLVAPEAGSATIGGRGYSALPAPSDEVGAVLEASSFHPGRSGRDHLRVYCTVNGYPRSRADEVLGLVGLAAAGRRRVRGYSLGMRQRLALATALLGDPGVLVLDEPTGGLDPEGIAWMRRLLRGFARQGRAVLVSSHVLSEVQQLVDHVVIINHGRLVWQGALDELSGHSAAVGAAGADSLVVSVRTPQADELLTALTRAGVDGARADRTGPDGLRVTGLAAADVGHLAFASGVELHGLTAERDDLEQVFFALTGSGGPTPGRVRPGDATAGEPGGRTPGDVERALEEAS
ncbi:MAG: ABC transporter ATP-binding protein [Carbonactinosporaceae bacterium]